MNNDLKYKTMSRLTIAIVGITLFLSVLQGCRQNPETDDKSISPKLITNPITADGKKSTGGLPVMEFEQTKHDFGMMVQGEKLSYTYKFKNTGGSDLIISNVSATCGCTVPDWTKTPVKPGEEGKVEVMFNSAGRSGTNTKTVMVLSNAQPNTTELEFTAEIWVPDSKK